jgi:polysaccharide export outer membrane protein
MNHMSDMATLLLVALLAQASAAPQGPQPSARGEVQAPQGPSGATTTNTIVEEYVIGPGDSLAITVYDERELTNTYRVDDGGFISFPLIGRVAAAGSTVRDLQERLRSMLANGFLRNPQIRIDVDQYKSQSVIVSGAVRAPQKLTIAGGSMTLLEALALAGSPTADASNEVIISRKKAGAQGDSEVEEIRVNRRELELGRAGRDVMLRDGDIVNVPVAQKFFIDGQVRNPGTYVLDIGMTVQQAIALAGGLTERGSDRGITAKRFLKGKPIEVNLRLDDKVQADDTITIRQRFF